MPAFKKTLLVQTETTRTSQYVWPYLGYMDDIKQTGSVKRSYWTNNYHKHIITKQFCIAFLQIWPHLMQVRIHTGLITRAILHITKRQHTWNHQQTTTQKWLRRTKPYETKPLWDEVTILNENLASALQKMWPFQMSVVQVRVPQTRTDLRASQSST